MAALADPDVSGSRRRRASRCAAAASRTRRCAAIAFLAWAVAGCAGLGSGDVFRGDVFRGDAPASAEAGATRGFALPVQRPIVQVGDRWVWSGHEVGDRASDDATVIERRVTRVDGERIELQQTTLHPVTRRPSGASQTRKARLSTWHLEPGSRSTGEIKALVFPLTPGKSWEYEYWLGGGQRDVVTTYRYRARVDGIETLRTPAGRFETLRVTHTGRWSRPVIEKGRPVERSGDVRTTYWYAPAVGTWVRLEVDLARPDGTRELGIVQELVEHGSGG